MATVGQIIFYSMVTFIFIFAALIILILSLAFSKSTSTVMSRSTKPVANLGEDKLLSCYVSTEVQQNRLSVVSVIWEKKDLGLVYVYKDGAPALAGQAPQFKGRAQVFPDAVAAGNASLLLRSVKSGDDGEYTCSISSSAGRGNVNIQLRTAAFSAPTFRFSDGVLTSEANSWFPKPNVTWLNQTGNVLNASTSFTQNSAGIVSLVSTLHSAQVSETYNCRIENNLAVALAEATITGSSVSARTYFTFSAASSLILLNNGHVMISVLCFCYVA
ncbi:V-set domain-containing T-cell activation inhibitor 1 [Kryptolebias marmoratus]|uniref:V-set domain containing T cell activation inhibitor 1 n=1 Tax=Kryptolebias marmoratus TaxID=37003 RepID=A0A3Q3GD83_KRYMA|nr:V-set domain-containing T-cell activation inhibitor 1 [Kryptolebias marmoratus]